MADRTILRPSHVHPASFKAEKLINKEEKKNKTEVFLLISKIIIQNKKGSFPAKNLQFNSQMKLSLLQQKPPKRTASIV
jgi:hypothetical protein